MSKRADPSCLSPLPSCLRATPDPAEHEENGAHATRTIDWHLDTGLNGCDLTGAVEVEPDATEADIEREVREDMWNNLSLSWRERAAQEGSGQ